MSNVASGNIEIGNTIKDNDPRNGGVTRTIIGFWPSAGETTHAVYQAGTRKARVRLDRIYNDGVARKTGWSLVSNIA